MAKRNVIPWHVDWPAVYAIDKGGFGSTAAAEKILQQHNDAGARGVRMEYSGDAMLSWLWDCYRRTATKHIVGLVWGSVFKKADTPAKLKAAYVRWTKYARERLTNARPEIVFLDHEVRYKELPHMPDDLRDMTDEILGDWTPIYIYRALDLFGEQGLRASKASCPALYGVFRDPKRSPLQMVHVYVAKASLKRAYPWLSPYHNPSDFSEGLAPMDDWLNVCDEVRMAGARGFCMYPSPYSKDMGMPLGAEIHQQLLERMELGSEVLRG